MLGLFSPGGKISTSVLFCVMLADGWRLAVACCVRMPTRPHSEVRLGHH
jgi:hypothetical protein